MTGIRQATDEEIRRAAKYGKFHAVQRSIEDVEAAENAVKEFRRFEEDVLSGVGERIQEKCSWHTKC